MPEYRYQKQDFSFHQQGVGRRYILEDVEEDVQSPSPSHGPKIILEEMGVDMNKQKEHIQNVKASNAT